jgi:hypothetical protein
MSGGYAIIAAMLSEPPAFDDVVILSATADSEPGADFYGQLSPAPSPGWIREFNLQRARTSDPAVRFLSVGPERWPALKTQIGDSETWKQTVIRLNGLVREVNQRMRSV